MKPKAFYIDVTRLFGNAQASTICESQGPSYRRQVDSETPGVEEDCEENERRSKEEKCSREVHFAILALKYEPLTEEDEVAQRSKEHKKLKKKQKIKKYRKELLSLTPLEVMRLAGESHHQSLQLLKLVSLACAPKVITAHELWSQRDDLCFSTSLPDLDRLLQGGLARGTITEVTGPSGCGKSQLCMMLSVLATLPRSMGGLDRGVIYIDTESAFSAERLLEIAQSRFPDYFSVSERLLHIAGRIHLFKELTCQEVLRRLEHLEEDIISCRAGLIILDSIASVVRKEFDTSLSGNLTHRSNLLGQEAATLKYLAQEFRIPVVLTNQITTHLSERASSSSLSRRWNVPEVPGAEAEGNSGYVTAALGSTWSHNVNTRLIVQYVDAHCRQIIIAKSPVAPFAVLNYTVQKEGIRLEGNAREEMSSVQGTDPGLHPIRVRTGFDYSLTEAIGMAPSTTTTGGSRCEHTGV